MEESCASSSGAGNSVLKQLAVSHIPFKHTSYERRGHVPVLAWFRAEVNGLRVDGTFFRPTPLNPYFATGRQHSQNPIVACSLHFTAGITNELHHNTPFCTAGQQSSTSQDAVPKTPDSWKMWGKFPEETCSDGQRL
jgi:hypothetical protein